MPQRYDGTYKTSLILFSVLNTILSLFVGLTCETKPQESPFLCGTPGALSPPTKYYIYTANITSLMLLFRALCSCCYNHPEQLLPSVYANAGEGNAAQGTPRPPT